MRVAGFLLVLLLHLPVAASAQPGIPAPQHVGPTAGEHVLFAGANALIGGVAAGVVRMARGGGFREAFPTGALGGGVTYAGKVIVTHDLPAAGLLGRSVASLGGSITRNASAGEAALQRLLLPLGPVRLHFEPGQRKWPRLSVDLPGIAAFGWAMIAHDDIRWDLGESLSSGAIVGHVEGDDWDVSRLGHNMAGTILLGPNHAQYSQLGQRRILGHERLHSLQYDQSYLLWGDALDDLIVRREGGGAGLWSHLDPGFHVIGILLAQEAIVYKSQPWEIEARTLSPLDNAESGTPGVGLHSP